MAIIVKVTPAAVERGAIRWAIDNCPNYITNTAKSITMTTDYEYHCYFAVPSEALMFQLKWGN